MDTDLRKLSPEELQRLYTARFQEYLQITRWLIAGFAILIPLLWLFDWSFDPVNAPQTLWFRLMAAATALVSALALGGRLGIAGSAILIYTGMLIIQALYTLILAILDGGFIIGIGGYLYFYLATILLGLPFSFRINTVGTLCITFAPHLAGYLVTPHFPHLLYASLIWPAGLISIFFHWTAGGLIIDRLHYRTRIETLSLEDPLTGLQNRRGLQRDYRKVRSLSQRENEDLSLILLDIDHFKSINDRYGHDTGDRVLEKLSTIMATTFRASDSLARIGGEEFVCLIPDANLEEAMDKAEELRRSVEQARVAVDPEGEDDTGFTISLGVTLARPTENLEHTLKRADEALYRAKHDGRNRVASAP